MKSATFIKLQFNRTCQAKRRMNRINRTNKTQIVFLESLMRKTGDGENLTYLSMKEETKTFVGSFSEPLCFIVLFISVCIFSYGFKKVWEIQSKITEEKTPPTSTTLSTSSFRRHSMI